MHGNSAPLLKKKGANLPGVRWFKATMVNGYSLYYIHKKYIKY